MTLRSAVDHDLGGYLSDAREAVAAGLAQYDQTTGAPQPEPQEPDLVASLLFNGVPALASKWGTRLSRDGFAIRITAVFAHQSPIVEHSLAQKAPELGDLLIVSVATDAHSRVQRRALLLQAKVSSTDRLRIPDSDSHQRLLYEQWPPFTYRRPRELRGHMRSVYPQRAHRGAQYLLLQQPSGSNASYDAWVAPVARQAVAERSLAATLCELLAVRQGRKFYSHKCSCNQHGWSQLVWDMVESAASRTFNRRRSGVVSRPRVLIRPAQQSGMAFLYAGTATGRSSALFPYSDTYSSVDSGDGFFSFDERDVDDEDPGATVLLIETFETGVAAG